MWAQLWVIMGAAKMADLHCGCTLCIHAHRWHNTRAACSSVVVFFFLSEQGPSGPIRLILAPNHLVLRRSGDCSPEAAELNPR